MPSSPTVLAGGQLGLLSRSEVAVAGAAAEDLLEALGRVPDPRDPRGRRYPLVPVLAIAVCAMLAGARSYVAIAEWAADAPPRLRARLGLPGPVPDLATIWRVLTTVDPAAVDRAVGAWVGAQLAAQRPAGQVVLAVDGKTVRGARTGDGTAPHLLACLDHGAGVVLAQVAVDGKTNEITVFTALLAQAGDLDGVLVTADALHAQREHATWLHERGAHYLVTVKGNQLLVHDAGGLAEPVLVQRRRQPGKCDGRDGQVVNELRIPAQRPAGLAQDAGQAAGAVGAQPAAGEEQPLRERVPLLLPRLGAGLGEHIVDMGTEALVRDVAAAIAHQQPLPGQQPLAREPEERGQHPPPGQVPGRPGKHEHHRSRIAAD